MAQCSGKCIVNGIYWFIMLLLSFWLYGFVCFVYLWSSILAACIGACADITNTCERWLKIPGTCSKNMVDGAEISCNCV